MFRFLGKLVLVILLGAFAAAAGLLYRSTDPLYQAAEWISLGRYDRYDALIGDAARKNGVDPLLIKAMVWRESEFHPDKRGTSGERGLMQVGEPAANDWARAHQVETFQPTDLFAPRTNLEIGSWYLKQALNRWGGKDDPVPFALAEYNAGRKRVERWIADSKTGADATAADLRAHIDFPGTSAYVEAILKRRAYYQEEQARKDGK